MVLQIRGAREVDCMVSILNADSAVVRDLTSICTTGVNAESTRCCWSTYLV